MINNGSKKGVELIVYSQRTKGAPSTHPPTKMDNTLAAAVVESAVVKSVQVLEADDEIRRDIYVDHDPDRSERRAPELLSSSELAAINLRFSVGEPVKCSIGNSFQEGVIIQRCYREDEWPSGLYAAVCSRDSMRCLCLH